MANASYLLLAMLASGETRRKGVVNEVGHVTVMINKRIVLLFLEQKELCRKERRLLSLYGNY